MTSKLIIIDYFLVHSNMSGFQYIQTANINNCPRRSRIACATVQELKDLATKFNLNRLTTYELLTNPRRRIYLDIENIPSDQPELITKLIDDWCKFIEVPNENISYTFNSGSHHEGLSYHVFIPYATYGFNILNGIRKFKCEHPEYVNYVDEKVYNRNRLFRLPDQRGAEPDSAYKPGKGRDDDVHKIVQGTWEECVIQNIDGLPDLNKIFEFTTDTEMKNKGAKRDEKKFPTSGPRNRDAAVELAKVCIELQHDQTQKTVEAIVKNNSSTNWASVAQNVLMVGIVALLIFMIVKK